MAFPTMVYAFNTLTSDATIPTANDTVVIAGVTYTFKASVTTTANEVKLGLDAAAALANLKAAINASDATVHGSLTVEHPHVVATTLTATTLKVVSKLPGLIGNFLPAAATSTHLDDWTAAFFAGGLGSLAVYITTLRDQSAGNINALTEQLLREIDSSSEVD